MTRYTLSLLDGDHQSLRASLFRDGRERAALALCGRSRHTDPWTGEFEERFVVRQVITVEEEAYVERTSSRMEWSTTPFYRALKLAEPRNFAVAVFHSHPDGPLKFSAADDVAEKELFSIAFTRLESQRPHLSVIMTENGDLVARAYEPDLAPCPVDLIRVIGSRWTYSYDAAQDGRVLPHFDRQIRAFGSRSTRDISKLRFGVVGGGGTGSAIGSILPRIGARNIAFFDPDYVDFSNLNRLHCSTGEDAGLRRRKVDVLGEAAARLGMSVSVARFPYAVDDRRCRDALRSCDVIFGCTDDHLGRNFLNRLAHFYLIPVIDLGLLIVPHKEGAGYETFDGRVTVVQPGYPCQVCRGLIKADVMLAEALRRDDPATYERHRRAGYVPDFGDPSPAVATFTTEVATMALNELFQRLTGFRGPEGHCSERVRRFDEVKDSDTVPGGRSRVGCKLCDRQSYNGRGDMVPFLDMTE